MSFRSPLCKHAWLLVGLLLLISQSVSAADRKILHLEIEPLGTPSSVRSNSSASLSCRLNYMAERLLDGHLRLELFDRKKRIGVVQVNDLALSGGDYEFTAMLPPLKSAGTKFIEIRPTFVENGGGDIVLDPLNLIVPNSFQRGMVATFVVDDPSITTETYKNLRSVLSPNRFNPWRNGQGSESRSLYFYPARYESTAVPVSAIQFCSADMVVICEESLGRLREKQLDAMEQWIRAGGVACIIPDGVLHAEHLGFLNRLTNVAERDGQPFLLKDDGLLDRDFGTLGYETNEFGLGRVAVISPELDWKELPESHLAALNGFIWRIRASHLKAVSMAATASRVIRAEWPLETGENGYDHRKIPAISGLIRRALPSDVRIIPFGVVGSLLVLFVLAIGPGDYFVLGLFKLRKFTWLVFPLVTLAFTLFTIWLSHRYMGSGDPGKPLIFLDVVEGNTVARSNEFSLIFSGSQRQVSQNFVNAIATPFNTDDFIFTYTQHPSMADRKTTGNITSYSGRFPSNYQMEQSVEQWSPQLNRVFRIAPEVQLPTFDWDSEQLRSGAGASYMRQLHQRVKAGFGPNASALLFDGEQIKPVMIGGVGSLFDDEQYEDMREWRTPGKYFGQRVPLNVLHEMCVRSPVKWFRTVSQISPTGADNFEDITLLDASDVKQWLLVVITEDEDAFRIYRRLYKDDDGAVAESGRQSRPGIPKTRIFIPDEVVREIE